MFEALKKGYWWNYTGNDEPKCPHCGADYGIAEHGAFAIREEGEHTITCAECDGDFRVYTEVSFTFSTDVDEAV